MQLYSVRSLEVLQKTKYNLRDNKDVVILYFIKYIMVTGGGRRFEEMKRGRESVPN